MTYMTLTQVRDELRRLASDGGFGQMADAIDAHLAQGEAVAWQYRRDGVEWHPLKEEFIEKAIRDGVEVRALYAAPPIAKPAQPVEAADDLSATTFICHLIDSHEGETVTEESLQSWLAEALAHSRPSHPEIPDSSMVEVVAEDANNYCRILTVLGMEEEGDPVAEVERLVAIAEAAPTGEQAGEVVTFEQWYAQNAFDLEANPLGSRECGLQRAAWNAALSMPSQVDKQDTCGCKLFCETCGRENIEEDNDGTEYCGDCGPDWGGELCRPDPHASFGRERADVASRAFMCKAHAKDHEAFCREVYAEQDSVGSSQPRTVGVPDGEVG